MKANQSIVDQAMSQGFLERPEVRLAKGGPGSGRYPKGSGDYNRILSQQREAEGLRAAILDTSDPDEQIIHTGNPGESHRELTNRIFHRTSEFIENVKPGFVNEEGEFLTRDEAEKYTGRRTSGEMFSKSATPRAVRLMDKYSSINEPKIRKAFVAAVANVRSKAKLATLERAIAANDVQAVMDIVGPEVLANSLKGSGFEPGSATFVDRMTETYRSGGTMGMEQLPKSVGMKASFDLTTERATNYLRTHIPVAIREITESQRQAIQTLLVGGNVGQMTVQDIARDLRDTIGLTETQAQYVRNFRDELESGTYQGGRRLSAVTQNQAVDATDQGEIDELVDEYYQSLVNYRAAAIARTECHDALIQGQQELWDQAEEEGLFEGENVRRFWSDTGDDRERDTHRLVPGMNPNGVGLHEPFQTPIGPVMNPGESGDPSFDIHCRCCVILDYAD